MEKEHIIQVDNMIESISKRDLESKKFLTKFCARILEAIGQGDQKVSPEQLIFSNSIDFGKKQFIAACLLRLLNKSDKFFSENTFRVKTFSLFDEVYKDSIYKLLKIRIKDQNIDKEIKLKGIINDYEKKLLQLIDSFQTIESYKPFRQKIQQYINNILFQEVYLPFLPYALISDQRLKEVFDSIGKYLIETGYEVINTYEELKEVLESYSSEANDYQTIYSQKVLKSMANKLMELSHQHLNSKYADKPAKIEIKKFEKKYPFHMPNIEINIIIIVDNSSDGYAFDVTLHMEGSIKILQKDLDLGEIKPNSSIELNIPCLTAKEPLKEVKFIVNVSHCNFNKKVINETFNLTFTSQRTDIDWDQCKTMQPYSLEPVTDTGKFIGRSSILKEIESLIIAEDGVGSSIIFGQKRVGKTSIAKMIELRFDKEPNYSVVYIESGDYVTFDAATTINNLGIQLSEKVKMIDRRLEKIDRPFFNNALSPFTNMLSKVNEIIPEHRIIFILDEFDELPVDLIKNQEHGKAFFQTIRSISNKPPFGFIIIGGEKTQFINNFHGDALNKFLSIRVDYFDKNHQWQDFKDLVIKPVENYFEFDDSAVNLLYKHTAGNPFFTKSICRELFKIMVERHDNHITEKEVNIAIKITLDSISSNIFQHFWVDGILDIGTKVEERSIVRKKIILSISEAIRESEAANLNYIIIKGKNYNLDEHEIESEIREFERREILMKENNNYMFKVKLFEKWLADRGYFELITTLVDIDDHYMIKKQEEELRIKPQEIISVTEKWGPYKGRTITEDKVRAWLEQFSSYKDQRLMFKILEGLTFYTDDAIRNKLKEAHGIIKRGLVLEIRERQRKRADIIVSYLDRPGKSGAYLAKKYADENNIYSDMVIEKCSITKVLLDKSKENSNIALVFIDDIVGTGNSACEYFDEILEEHDAIINQLTQAEGKLEGTKKLNIFFIAICGFQDAIDKVNTKLNRIKLPIDFHVCDILSDSDKVFINNTNFYKDESECSLAKSIAYAFGKKLVNNNPLGYGGCQAAIVFPTNCPNVCLPILWQEKGGFKPLFKR